MAAKTERIVVEIADGIVIVAAGNHEQPVYGVTPAEAVVLHKLHFANAKGNPLKDFKIVEGQAMTKLGQKKEKAKRKNLEGAEVEVEISVPIERVRTGQEELVRLRKAYFGTVKGMDGKSAPVVNVCFPGASPILPTKFAEIEGNLDGVSPGFFAPRLARANAPGGAAGAKDEELGTGEAEIAAKRKELMEHTRAELVELVEGMKITVAQDAKKAELVEAILAASKDAVKE